MQLCIPGDCSGFASGPAQCDGNRCFEWEEGAGRCEFAGSVAVGEPCTRGSTASSQQCVATAWCDAPAAQPSAGTCRLMCDFWGSPGCGVGQLCEQITDAIGVCVPAQRVPLFDVCQNPGSPCNDRAVCLTVTTQAGPENLCMPLCRRERTDCAGVRLGVTQTACDWNTFRNSTSVGLCLPPCPGAACAEGQSCLPDGTCARPCDTDAACQPSAPVCFDGICKPSGS
ncbi:MAG: hypothetical protein EA398_00780 [Deltaproteobacteria bacterium]|nr:MAG: hypothetical protein EA398_00780 [Deltaproteobacteria bacterium]